MNPLRARRPLHLLVRRALLVVLLAAPGLAQAKPRVVVLGFDGADAAVTERLMAAGELPHLKALREKGGFSPLGTTNPPQTPVSWSTFATGLNPGRTTIFDFLKRDAKSYIPVFALNEESSRPFLWGKKNGKLGALVGAGLGLLVVGGALALFRRTRKAALLLGPLAAVGLCIAGQKAFARLLPVKVPVAVNNRQGDTFWDLAAAAGKKTEIVRVPATFPAAPLAGGKLLAGLGVPDIRGTNGTFSFYTTARLAKTEDSEFGGKIVELDPFERETRTVVYGPRNKLFYEVDKETKADPEGDPKEIDLPMTLRKEGGGLHIEVSGKTLTLKPDQWSDWVELDFPFNRLLSAHGIARFHLLEVEPDLRLYLSPVNIHPRRPPVPLSSPGGWAWDLKQQHGFYKTLGWAEDVWSYTEDRVDEKSLLEDIEATVAKEEEFLDASLKARDFDLFVQVFSFTDRIQHVFWRLTDPEHPAYDAELARTHGGTIDAWYRRMDKIVGRAQELIGDDPETLLLVCSDHGFATWRRSVNYNTWLVKNGFMTLKTTLGGRKLTLEDLFGNKQFWPYVDWSKTRAYSLGLGNIYVNLKGREPRGIVAPGAEYDTLIASLKAGLEGMVDPAGTVPPVRKVYSRDEMYHDFDPDVLPDLRVANNVGYRVSWQSSLGATPAEIFEDNKKKWSADHCSLDPALVPGILFASTPIKAPAPHIGDLMPTILQHLGVAVPAGLDGKPAL